MWRDRRSQMEHEARLHSFTRHIAISAPGSTLGTGLCRGPPVSSHGMDLHSALLLVVSRTRMRDYECLRNYRARPDCATAILLVPASYLLEPTRWHWEERSRYPREDSVGCIRDDLDRPTLFIRRRSDIEEVDNRCQCEQQRSMSEVSPGANPVRASRMLVNRRRWLKISRDVTSVRTQRCSPRGRAHSSRACRP